MGVSENGGIPTKNDQHLGCEMGVPLWKHPYIYVWDKKRFEHWETRWGNEW